MAEGDLFQSGEQLQLEIGGKMVPVPQDWAKDPKGFYQYSTKTGSYENYGRVLEGVPWQGGVATRAIPYGGETTSGVTLQTPQVPYAAQEAGEKEAKRWQGWPPWLVYAMKKSTLPMMEPLRWAGYGPGLDVAGQSADVAYEKMAGKPPSGLRSIASAAPGFVGQLAMAGGLPRALGATMLPKVGALGRALPGLAETLESYPKLATALGWGAGVGTQSLAFGQPVTPYHAYKTGSEIARQFGYSGPAGGVPLAVLDTLFLRDMAKRAMPSNALEYLTRQGATLPPWQRLKQGWKFMREGGPTEAPAAGGKVSAGADYETRAANRLGLEAGEGGEVPANVKMAKARKKGEGAPAPQGPFSGWGETTPFLPIASELPPSEAALAYLDIPTFVRQGFRPRVSPEWPPLPVRRSPGMGMEEYYAGKWRGGPWLEAPRGKSLVPRVPPHLTPEEELDYWMRRPR